MLVYNTDENGIWTGESRDVLPKQGRHRREIPQEPPALGEGQYAQWRGYLWVVLDTYPPEPPLYETADIAKSAMVGWIDRMTAKIMSTYPQAVRTRWPEEEAAARAVIADTATTTQTTMITDEGASKGRTATEHANIIIAHADNFRAIAGEINKLYLFVDGALDAATEPDQYEVIINDAKDQAQVLAQAYGLI